MVLGGHKNGEGTYDGRLRRFRCLRIFGFLGVIRVGVRFFWGGFNLDLFRHFCGCLCGFSCVLDRCCCRALRLGVRFRCLYSIRFRGFSSGRVRRFCRLLSRLVRLSGFGFCGFRSRPESA